MNKLQHFLSVERGQTLVMMALMLLVLLLFVGLALDGGYLWVQRTQMQVAADTGAAAGAHELLSGRRQSDIWSQINQYAVTANKADAFLATYYPGGQVVSGSSNGSPPGGQNGVCVTATKEYPTFLMGLAGVDTVHVEAKGCAEVPVGLCAGGYAFWANSTTCGKTIDWSGGSWSVTGNVHSNHDIDCTSASNVVSGLGEYVTTIASKLTFIPAGPTNPRQVNPTTTYPVSFALADYQPGGRAALAAGAHYYAYTSGHNFSSLPNDGLYYVNGDIGVSAGKVTRNVTLVATGTINWSGSNVNIHPYVDGLWLFSTATQNCNGGNFAVNISGGNSQWTGVVFTPNGGIQASGSSSSTQVGSLIGNTLKLSGSSGILAYSGTLCSGQAVIANTHLINPQTN
jgi:hypothetical protein